MLTRISTTIDVRKVVFSLLGLAGCARAVGELISPDNRPVGWARTCNAVPRRLLGHARLSGMLVRIRGHDVLGVAGRQSAQDPERSRACTIMGRGVVCCWESCADVATSRGHLEFSHQLFRSTQQNEMGRRIVVQPSNMGFRGTTRLKGAVLTLLSVLAVG